MYFSNFYSRMRCWPDMKVRCFFLFWFFFFTKFLIFYNFQLVFTIILLVHPSIDILDNWSTKEKGAFPLITENGWMVQLRSLVPGHLIPLFWICMRFLSFSPVLLWILNLCKLYFVFLFQVKIHLRVFVDTVGRYIKITN